MNLPWLRAVNRRMVVLIGLVGAAVGSVLLQTPARGLAQEATWQIDRELAMKITQPFSLASVGDLTIMRPVSQLNDAAFQAAIKVARDADVAFANFESNISDMRRFTGPMYGFMGTKEVAADVKAMGFDMVNKAGNHLMESGEEGLMSTAALLDEAGIVYAGVGADLDEARAARFLETPKGRIGVVGLHPSPSQAATPRVGNVGGRPGLNSLPLTTTYIVTQEQIDGMRQTRDAMYKAGQHVTNRIELPANEPRDRLAFLGNTYKVGAAVGTKSYTMGAADLRENLKSIRNGKFYADFMIATIHAHEGKWVAQKFPYEDETPDYLIEFAHKAIDNGADAFLGHGPHALRGIEIYKGKPIFYGLGQFIRQSDWRSTGINEYRMLDADPFSTDLTPAEIAKMSMDRRDVRGQSMYESVIAVSKYDGGRLQDVRLYPVDMGFDRPLSQVGYPRVASAAMSQRVLEHLRVVSKPFGTTIAIEGNIGVIKIASGAGTTGQRP